MPGDYGTVQQEARGFSVKETIVGRTVSLSKDDNCEMNIKIICYLKSAYYMQCRVNNLNIKKRKMSLAHFKVKQINIYRLAYTGNLVLSAIVSCDFWESIRSKIK